MEESYLEHENKQLKEELLNLHRKLEEYRKSNNWLYGQLLKSMEDKYRQLDAATYCMDNLILN